MQSVSLKQAYEAMVADASSPGYSLGYKELDNFGLISPGELIILGARPGMGKTWVMANLALQASKVAPVMFFTLESSCKILMQRFLSIISGRNEREISAEIKNNQYVDVLGLSKEIQKYNLMICDLAAITIDNIRQEILTAKQSSGIQYVFIDYVQLVSINTRHRNREGEIKEIVTSLKQIAVETNTIIIASSQLSRAVETRGGDKRPLLSDLRESGAIEEEADRVLFLYRPEYYGFTEDEYGNSTFGRLCVICAKNRNGQTGEAVFTFIPSNGHLLPWKGIDGGDSFLNVREDDFK